MSCFESDLYLDGMKACKKGACAMRRVSGIAAVLLLAGVLCVGCSAGASGAEDPNLVVYNDSTAVLGSISVSGENEGQVVSMADGHPLERGESYGFEVKAPGPVWVELWDLDGTQVGRRRVNLGEERVYVTLEEHSRMTVGTAEPWRN